MKCSKRSFAVVTVLFALLLSLSAGTLNARGVDVTPPAVTEHYNWYLDLWQKAEGRGFGGIFFSECLL